MRFIYGFIMGVLVSVIGAILYLAFANGEYLLQLSPHYHEMTSTIASLKEAKEQRDQLAARLDTLTNGFEQLTRRFNDLQEATKEPAHRGAGPQVEPALPTSEAPRVRAHPEPTAVAPAGP
jgi:hypothetical protein